MWIAAALLTDLRSHLWRGTLGLRWLSLRCSGNLRVVFHRRFWFEAGWKLDRKSHIARFVFFLQGRYLGLRIGLRGYYRFGCFFGDRARLGWLHF
jgi:hypothetical protein